MNIFCRVDDCTYQENGDCKREYISLSEDGECECCKSYLDTDEWKKPFYKRMMDKENKCVCRVMYYGKEIEICGRVFFVESRSEYAYLTDAITGMGIGTAEFVRENFDKIIEAEKKVGVPLGDLPIAEYDEVSRTFEYEARE